MHAGDWLRRGRAERTSAGYAAGAASAANAAGSTRDGGGEAGVGFGAAMDFGESLLVSGDGWSLAVAESGVLGRPPATAFEVFLTIAADPRPSASKSWANAVKARAQAEKSAPRKLRALLSALASAAPAVAPRASLGADGAGGAGSADGADARPILVSRENTIVAVNTVAAAAHVLGEAAVPNLGAALCRLLEEPWTVDSTSIRDACAGALAAIGTEQAFEELKAAVPRAQTKVQREVLLLCLGRMPWSAKDAKAAGASMAELVVPTHGLNVAGKRELTTHHRNFELTLHEDGSVGSRSLDDAQVVENQAAERVLRAELRAISATYRKEVARIEALLATEHSWSPETWRKLYLDHPITRAVASRLVWRLAVALEKDGGGAAGTGGARRRGGRGARVAVGRTIDVVPAWEPAGLLRIVNAQRAGAEAAIPWPDGVSSVQLWHPREAAPEDLAAWRAALRDVAFDQPFQQIKRDFVASESDPEKTEFDRFAGEVTDAAAWEAALAEIPWTMATKSGGKTSDREDLIHREFPAEKVTATAMFTRLSSFARPPQTASPQPSPTQPSRPHTSPTQPSLPQPSPTQSSPLQPFPPQASQAGPSLTQPSPVPPPVDAAPDRIRLGAAWIHRTDDKSLTPLPLSTLPARLCSEVERDLHVLMNPPTDAVATALVQAIHSVHARDAATGGPSDAVPS